MNFTVPGVARSKRMQALNSFVSDEWGNQFLQFMIPLFFRDNNTYRFINEDAADSWKNVCRNPNITLKIIEDNLNIPWDWSAIVTHPNFNIDFYERHLDKPWNWEPTPGFFGFVINLEFLEKYKDDPNIPWNWDIVSMNNNITMDFVERNMEGVPWNWEYIARNKNLTMDFVERHLDEINWYWEIIAANPALTMDFVERHRDINWNWSTISSNPSLTIKFLEKNMNKPWNWDRISENPAITLDYIKKHPIPNTINPRTSSSTGHLNYIGLSKNPNITMEFIQQNRDAGWYFRWLSSNPNLTMEFVEENISKNWDWCEMARNPRLTMEFVERNLKLFDTDECWKNLSENPSITMDFAERHIDKLFAYNICGNPSVTMEFIKKLFAIPKVNKNIALFLSQVASNTFSVDKAMFLQEWNRKYVLTTRLQKAVRERMFDNPKYKSARERQMRQFDDTEAPSEMTDEVKGYLENIKQMVDYQKIPPELRDFLVKK
jgi:hypothetical protein